MNINHSIFYNELFKGKGLLRAFLYEELATWRGKIAFPLVDIACGENPGYRRILGLMDKRFPDIITVDISEEVYPDIVHDIASGPLPFSDKSFKTAFLMNCLYLFIDPLMVMCETQRILVKGGRLFATFPFVFPYTPEPCDLHRFTEECVRGLFTASGFSILYFASFGGRWSSAASLIGPFLRPSFVFGMPIFAFARLLDWISILFFPRMTRAPIGYFVIAERI